MRDHLPFNGEGISGDGLMQEKHIDMCHILIIAPASSGEIQRAVIKDRCLSKSGSKCRDVS